jgi:hypothetical protein
LILAGVIPVGSRGGAGEQKQQKQSFHLRSPRSQQERLRQIQSAHRS